MRAYILALSFLGLLAHADVANAGPSTADREVALLEPASMTDEANQQTEDRIGLDKTRRRDVQRQLTGLGFDTKINGTFSKSTRAVIMRWQAARGYPKTGFFNTLEHEALLTEVVATAPANSSDRSNDGRSAGSRNTSSPHRNHGSGGGPVGFVGGVVGGLFGRR
jgi:peptidoglycan hydrolase-like protein with peptidoglycan-binding domain